MEEIMRSWPDHDDDDDDDHDDDDDEFSINYFCQLKLRKWKT